MPRMSRTVKLVLLGSVVALGLGCCCWSAWYPDWITGGTGYYGRPRPWYYGGRGWYGGGWYGGGGGSGGGRSSPGTVSGRGGFGGSAPGVGS